MSLRAQEESSTMHKMTERNMSDAYAGESQAFMKYNIWADKAENEGKKGVAKLFRAISHAEKVHATNHWRALGMIKGTKENLERAIEGERYEVEEMYPVFKAVAEYQKERAAVQATDYALEAEKVHAKMYEKAKDAVEAGKDIQVGDIYVCPVCGYTMEGSAPDKCPICGARKDSFKKF
jgi:rubrerythrin